jgi:hypothetical protein
MHSCIDRLAFCGIEERRELRITCLRSLERDGLRSARRIVDWRLGRQLLSVTAPTTAQPAMVSAASDVGAKHAAPRQVVRLLVRTKADCWWLLVRSSAVHRCWSSVRLSAEAFTNLGAAAGARPVGAAARAATSMASAKSVCACPEAVVDCRTTSRSQGCR